MFNLIVDFLTILFIFKLSMNFYLNPSKIILFKSIYHSLDDAEKKNVINKINSSYQSIDQKIIDAYDNQLLKISSLYPDIFINLVASNHVLLKKSSPQALNQQALNQQTLNSQLSDSEFTNIFLESPPTTFSQNKSEKLWLFFSDLELSKGISNNNLVTLNILKKNNYFGYNLAFKLTNKTSISKIKLLVNQYFLYWSKNDFNFQYFFPFDFYFTEIILDILDIKYLNPILPKNYPYKISKDLFKKTKKYFESVLLDNFTKQDLTIFIIFLFYKIINSRS